MAPENVHTSILDQKCRQNGGNDHCAIDNFKNGLHQDHFINNKKEKDPRGWLLKNLNHQRIPFIL